MLMGADDFSSRAWVLILAIHPARGRRGRPGCQQAWSVRLASAHFNTELERGSRRATEKGIKPSGAEPVCFSRRFWTCQRQCASREALSFLSMIKQVLRAAGNAPCGRRRLIDVHCNRQ
jgi:hypothetical protein